ncbi:photosynthetic reaction center subunit H [Gemmatimonas sp.]|jgi:photosynthetic reaction center H subunit|uniref:photosynthetic reaction center subunit H n=1 Tax=Gemmatimonas sp. TaxID=1962908 RepID=UPI00391A1B04
MSDVKFVPADNYNGSPIIPTGNPMIDGVGPAAWATDRRDEPDLTYHGTAKIVPMRLDPTYSVAKGDPDPRGLPVIAADKQVAGTVVEIWVNRSEPQVSFYEVQLVGSARRVLLPVGYVQWPNLGLWGNDKLLVKSITAAQFQHVPATKRDDQITLLEEDRITAYYAGGHMYAFAERAQPII